MAQYNSGHLRDKCLSQVCFVQLYRVNTRSFFEHQAKTTREKKALSFLSSLARRTKYFGEVDFGSDQSINCFKRHINSLVQSRNLLAQKGLLLEKSQAVNKDLTKSLNLILEKIGYTEPLDLTNVQNSNSFLQHLVKLRSNSVMPAEFTHAIQVVLQKNENLERQLKNLISSRSTGEQTDRSESLTLALYSSELATEQYRETNPQNCITEFPSFRKIVICTKKKTWRHLQSSEIPSTSGTFCKRKTKSIMPAIANSCHTSTYDDSSQERKRQNIITDFHGENNAQQNEVR